MKAHKRNCSLRLKKGLFLVKMPCYGFATAGCETDAVFQLESDKEGVLGFFVLMEWACSSQPTKTDCFGVSCAGW